MSISGTSRTIARIASSAAAVRNVTSATGRPPATRAFASGTAFLASSKMCIRDRDMTISRTNTGTLIAPFVNAETTEYLVLEDAFPNGRPPLERAGVYFTDRATVEKAEKMKVGTCLNPLHTALAVYGLSLIHI